MPANVAKNRCRIGRRFNEIINHMRWLFVLKWSGHKTTTLRLLRIHLSFHSFASDIVRLNTHYYTGCKPVSRHLLSYVYQIDRFLQGVSIACYASPVLVIVGMSVCLSVRLSVTHWHWVKTTQARITISSSTDSLRTLVFGIKKLIQKLDSRQGSTRARALNESRVGKIRNFQPISRLRRIARACFHLTRCDASKKWTCQFFVVESQLWYRLKWCEFLPGVTQA